MRAAIASILAALLAAAPMVQGDPQSERTQGACFNVKIQNDRVNEAAVEQNCNRNFSRTVQAGQSNWSETVQTGEINNNKVRQYHYENLRYSDCKRGEAPRERR
jgi:hypothetical protein